MSKFIIKNLCIFILILIQTGCATKQSALEPNLEADPNAAIIILNRPNALIAAFNSVPVYANGKFIGDIGNGGVLKWRQRAGIMDLNISHQAFPDSEIHLRQEVKKGGIYTFNYKFNSLYGPSEIEFVENVFPTNNKPQQVDNANVGETIAPPVVDKKEITKSGNSKEVESSSSIEDRLLLIKQMYNDGLITKEEYDKERKEVMEKF